MEACVATFTARLQRPWLTYEAGQKHLAANFLRFAERLQTLPAQHFFVIAANCPLTTLAAVLAALATGRATLLGNPQWTPAEVHNAQNTLGGEQLWLQTEANNAAPENVQTGAPQTHTVTLCHKAGDQPATLPAATLHNMLLIPTGGTGGRLKLACHNWQTLSTAIDGYARFWGLREINCVCPLSVCHIGGLMLALRSFASGGRLCLLPWKELQALADATEQPEAVINTAKMSTRKFGELCDVAEQSEAAESIEATRRLTALTAAATHWHLSLVPTQVQHLLGSAAAVQWLRTLQAVLIGGGASRPELLQAAAAQGIPLSPAYGMTETAATIALQRPQDFLRQWQTAHTPPPAPQGEVLPHLTASTEPQSGRIILSGGSLFHGYYPEAPRQPDHYATGDYGQVEGSAPQRLRVLGRLDRVVISGGKKIDPALVEHSIYAEAQTLGYALRGVLVTGVADVKWGKRLVAFIEVGEGQAAMANPPQPEPPASPATPVIAANSTPLADSATGAIPEALQQNLRNRLAAYQLPKQWIAVHTLPLDERGKPDRSRIAGLTEA